MNNRIDYEKEDFLEAIQHNLRTPLSSLMGFTQLALEELQKQESGDKLKNAISNLQKSYESFERLNTEVTLLSEYIDSKNI